MSILDHPEARALLDDAVATAEAVDALRGRLDEFLARYLPRFYRVEQRRTAALVLRGRLGGLERKTREPIAIEADVPRKPVQFFVGAGKWDDEAVMAELRGHVAEELGDPAGVVVVDGSGFAKKGVESCGVSRQWCGRLGKVENCQVGVFLAYATSAGSAPLDRQLYLPEDWALDSDRRAKCHVPSEVVFQEKWRIALDLLDRSLPGVPHGWIAADDEFGRASEFRAALRKRSERYVLDVPGDTTVRDLEDRPPPKRPGQRRRRVTPFLRAAVWAARQPASRWERIVVDGGDKGPVKIEAAWFLCLERRRIGGKNPGGDHAPSPPGPDAVAALRPAGDDGRDHPRRQPSPGTHRGGANSSLVQGHGPVPAPPPLARRRRATRLGANNRASA